MPVKQKPRKLFFNIDYRKGLTPYSGVLIPDGGSPDMRNVENYRGHLRRGVGLSELTATTISGELPLMFDEFYISSGVKRLMQITDTSCREYSAGAWDSKGAHGSVLTTSNNPDLFISGTVAEDLHIITDGVNNVRKFTGAGNYGNLLGLYQADDGGNPFATFTAECILYHYQHLLVGSTVEDGTDFPYRIRWSHTADVEEWSSGNQGFQDLDDTTDRVSVMMPLLDKIYVYKTGSIWEGTYVGYPRMFYFTPLIKQVGLIARKSLVKHSNFHIGLMNEGIFLIQGRQIHDITKELRPLLFGVNSELDMSTVGHSVGAYVEELGEYWLAVPLSGETYPTNIFRYNLKEESWWRKETSLNFYCSGSWQEATELSWDTVATATTSWDDMDAIWNSKALGAGVDNVLWGSDDSGDSYTTEISLVDLDDVGTTEAAYYETKDLITPESARNRWSAFWIEAEGSGTVNVQYSTDEGVTWTTIQTRTLSANFSWLKFFFDVTAEIIRFRVNFSTSTCHVRKLKAYYHEREA